MTVKHAIKEQNHVVGGYYLLVIVLSMIVE
jgi:hypothetical protein